LPAANDSTNGFKPAYLPALDGLRGVAILIVMIFHLDLPFFPGGFVGVDIFFVLSGFLITSLLIHEFDTTRGIRLRHFYLRRALRLGPAMVAMLLVFCLCSLALLDTASVNRNLIDALIAFFYLGNWARAFLIHSPDFLAHTWSLGIEEQFYLAWPLLLYVLLRARTPRRRVAAVAVGIALLCWCTRAYYMRIGTSFDRIYNGLDTHADGLMVGCTLGAVLASGLLDERTRQWLRGWLRFGAPLMAAGLVAFAFVAEWMSPWIYYWGMFGVALAAGGLILEILVDPRGRIGSLLTQRGLVWTGTISYGLYLWHYPIFRTLQAMGLGAPAVFAVGVPVTFAIAAISYRYLERPILNLARPSVWRAARQAAFDRTARAASQ
jgi:peptidoglycan/LPS O-acetylase OafA/YrhL